MKYLAILASLIFLASSASARMCSPCDIDGDGLRASIRDTQAFYAAMGSKEGDKNYNAKADFDGSKSVTVADFGIYQKWCK